MNKVTIEIETPAEYEKPTLVEEEEMIFPEEVWKQFSEGRWCFGCSNCNCN